MSFGAIFLTALIIGGIIGVVAILWDSADGEVLWLGEVVHSKAATIGLGLFAFITLLWAFGLVGGDIVLTAGLSLVAWVIAAYITASILPGV